MMHRRNVLRSLLVDYRDSLAESLRLGNYPKVVRLLKKGVDVESEPVNVPYMSIACQYCERAVPVLFQHRAPLRIPKSPGIHPPLWIAIQNHRPELVERLLVFMKGTRVGAWFLHSQFSSVSLAHRRHILQLVNQRTEISDYVSTLLRDVVPGTFQMCKVLDRLLTLDWQVLKTKKIWRLYKKHKSELLSHKRFNNL